MSRPRVNRLYDGLKLVGLMSNKLMDLGENYLSDESRMCKVPAGPAYFVVDRARLNFQQALDAGDKEAAAAARRILLEIKQQEAEAIREKKRAVETSEKSRLAFATEARKAIIQLEEACGREIDGLCAAALDDL